VLNGATAVPLPDNIALTEAYTASPPAYDVEPPGYTNTRPVDAAELARFTNAMRLGPGQIAEHLEHDPEITMTSGPEGLTFTNTAAFGNRFVKFFHHPVAGGLIDFSRLDDYTGKVGVTVRAAVDLSAGTGGFYCRMKRAFFSYTTHVNSTRMAFHLKSPYSQNCSIWAFCTPFDNACRRFSGNTHTAVMNRIIMNFRLHGKWLGDRTAFAVRELHICRDFVFACSVARIAH